MSMYVNVNNGERPDIGETTKTPTRRVVQRYFDYLDILYLQKYLPITKLFYSIFLEEYMHFITSKLLYAHTKHIVAKWINRLSTVIELASSNPVKVPCFFLFFCFFVFFLSIIY